jgi:glutaredoxin
LKLETALLRLQQLWLIKFGMELMVYSSQWCPDCREAKRFLTRHNINYTEIDIETVPGAADEVIQRTGKRAIPQFVIDGEWVQPYRPGQGFLYQEMTARLGLAGAND